MKGEQETRSFGRGKLRAPVGRKNREDTEGQETDGFSGQSPLLLCKADDISMVSRTQVKVEGRELTPQSCLSTRVLVCTHSHMLIHNNGN